MEGNQNFTHSTFLVGDIIIQENNYLQDERERSQIHTTWPTYSSTYDIAHASLNIHLNITYCYIKFLSTSCVFFRLKIDNVTFHTSSQQVFFLFTVFLINGCFQKQNSDIICNMYQVLLCHGVPLILKIKGSTVLIFHSDMKYLPSSWSYA